MLDAGKYFLSKQRLSVGVSDAELIHIAIKSMGLDELGPFDPKQRIIEYILEDQKSSPLINMKLNDFADETASESPAPGGGSISAYVGVLGVSLGTMVANLSAAKKGWENQYETFSSWAEKGQAFKKQLLSLVDEDTASFNAIMAAFQLPKNTDEEKSARSEAIQKATKYAIEIPLKVMQTAYYSMEVMKEMVAIGNPNSITDAGVGALCARTAVMGAHMNVRINASGFKDKEFLDKVLVEAKLIEENAVKLEAEIVEMVNKSIG
jgi:glutamate formiminotransferase/formiminotetrahydrofolate cyclodeaminase